jgi:RNA polymerase sigma-70 factor (ECF subfamily)
MMPLTAEQFEEHRPRLFALAYRMLGSASEAEDVVQDAYLRASEEPAIRDLRAFLVTVTTRLCLDRLKAARAVREQYIGPWLPEPILQQPGDGAGEQRAERAESVAMAVLVMLETLSPLERAVFLLREAFEYPYDEIGTILGRSAAACRQAYHRARAHLDAQRPRFRAPPEQQRRLVLRFLEAARGGDLAALTGMLAADVVSWGDGGGVAPAARRPVRGARAVARLMIGLMARVAEQGIDQVALDWVNGEPGLLAWENGRLSTVMVFEADGERIAALRTVRNPAKLAHLAARVAPPPGAIDP